MEENKFSSALLNAYYLVYHHRHDMPKIFDDFLAS